MTDTRIRISKRDHRYTDGISHYHSVTELINKYKQPFNTEYWSLYKAYQMLITNKLKNVYPNLSDDNLERKAKVIIKDDLVKYYASLATDELRGSREDMNALESIIVNGGVKEEEITEYRNIILDSWKNSKDTASNRGNLYHAARESKALKTGKELNAFDNKEYIVHKELLGRQFNYDSTDGRFEDLDEALLWNMDNYDVKFAIDTNLFETLEDGFYPELILWNDNYRVAGTSDRIFVETILGDRFVDIDDYKTNATIDKKSFYVKGEGYRMMLPPVNHMMDCKHNYYWLQVSIYAYMLEQMGFIVRKVGYHHLNALNSLTYLRDEAVDILNDFSNGGVGYSTLASLKI
jgi:hypothetical protein